jgi:TonB family protein
VNALLIKLTGLTAAAAIVFSPLAATMASAQQNVGQAAGPSCAEPNLAASTVYAAEPETPAMATSMHLTGTTLVQVDLDASGSIVGTLVAKSSGTPILDLAALRATRASTFRSQVQNCLAFAGSYLFEVQFPE